MSAKQVKTPICCLEEHLAPRRITPIYELIRSVTGTHKTEFTFRVQVRDMWEEGTGRSKQEAKHRAAENMLIRLNLLVEDDANFKYKDKTVVNISAEHNFIGELRELCSAKHFPEPEFCLEEVTGPDHNKVFKMICRVSKLQDFGISRTKQQAKHKAASKMLQRLKNVKREDLIKTESQDIPFEIRADTLPVGFTEEEEMPGSSFSGYANFAPKHKYRNSKQENGSPKHKYCDSKEENDSPKHVPFSPLEKKFSPLRRDFSVLYRNPNTAYRHLHEYIPALSDVLYGSSKVTSENALPVISDKDEEL